MAYIEWTTASIGISGIIALLAIAGLWRAHRGVTSGFRLRDDPSTTLATSLLVLGIVFGTERLIGYSFIGAGVLLSILTATRSRKRD